MPARTAAADGAANGLAWAFWGVMWQTTVQTQVAPAVLDRVTSYEVFGPNGSLPIGQSLSVR